MAPSCHPHLETDCCQYLGFLQLSGVVIPSLFLVALSCYPHPWKQFGSSDSTSYGLLPVLQLPTVQVLLSRHPRFGKKKRKKEKKKKKKQFASSDLTSYSLSGTMPYLFCKQFASSDWTSYSLSGAVMPYLFL